MPKGWTWCRLGDLCLFQNGYAFLSSKFSKDGKTKVIRISDITDGFVDESNCVFSLEEVEDDSFLVKKGDLLIAMSGATTGKNGIYNSDNIAYINQRVGNIKVRTPDALLPDFRNYYIQAMETEILKQAYGGAQPNISSTKILEMFFPLPPLIEQKEIVSKLEIAFEQIISIDANKNDLQIAIKKAKSKILDLAIHGKLVPQDTNDESASILLEKLRAEKEEKIAKGELKRDKNDSYIYKGSDNCYYEKFVDGTINQIDVPFDLPYNWSWCKLNELANISRGGSPRPIENYITTDIDGINWIKIGDTSPESKYIIGAKEKIKPSGIKHSRFVHSGDFLLTNSMSFGRPYILKINGCIHDGWLVFSDIKSCLDQDYLYYALSSKYIYNAFSLVAAGSTVKNLKSDTVKQVIFPIPPIEEQKRIVLTIDKLFTELKQIQNNFI